MSKDLSRAKSKESDLWNRTITQLKYSQLLLRECVEYCNTAIRESQNTSIILGKALEARLLRTRIDKVALK